MPTKEGSFQGIWDSGKDKITVSVPVILFEEDGSQIMYCPALDVSGYGKTELEANESFHISLGEFFLYTTHKKTFIEELRKLGWTIRKSKHKPMIPPPMSELLSTNENFSRIFNGFPFRKIDESISLPC
jgi:hypothetical protein